MASAGAARGRYPPSDLDGCPALTSMALSVREWRAGYTRSPVPVGSWPAFPQGGHPWRRRWWHRRRRDHAQSAVDSAILEEATTLAEAAMILPVVGQSSVLARLPWAMRIRPSWTAWRAAN